MSLISRTMAKDPFWHSNGFPLYAYIYIYILVSLILTHRGIFNEFLVLPHIIDTYLARLLCLLLATH